VGLDDLRAGQVGPQYSALLRHIKEGASLSERKQSQSAFGMAVDTDWQLVCLHTLVLAFLTTDMHPFMQHAPLDHHFSHNISQIGRIEPEAVEGSELFKTCSSYLASGQ
jgi:hypothetical protein